MRLIEVTGDDQILLDGIQVGKLDQGWPTLRDAARALIDGADDYSERLTHDEVVALEDAAYDRGFADAKEAAAIEIDEAYDRGHSDGAEAAQDDG